MPHWDKENNPGRKLTDKIVNFLSGRTPAPGFEGPAAFGAAALIGAVALIGSGWLIWHSIYRLGRIETATDNVNTSAIAKLEKLRDQDTDEDGLSDYDELYAYHTSPYLRDSDSDGASDADELTALTNPNCPSGQDCDGNTDSSATASDGMTAGFLRETLAASGVSQTVLNAMTDSEVIAVYEEVASTAVNANGNININSAPATETLESLSAADIRKLLSQTGVDQDELDQIDDDTLKEIFNQALNE